MLEAAILIIFPLCMGIAAFSDLLTMTIPNRVSIILVASFIIIAPLAGMPVMQIGMHFAAALTIFAAVFALFAFNIMGGGDAKLLTAAALWFGWNDTLVAFLAQVSVFGGLLTLIVIILRSRTNSILAYGLPIPDHILYATKVPYGVAIGIAGFILFPSSPLMQLIQHGL